MAGISTAVGAGMQVLGAGVNAWAGARAARKIAKTQAEQNQALKLLNLKESNANALETAANRIQLQRAQGAFNNAINNSRGGVAVAGGTTAAIAAQKASANNALGNTMANMAETQSAQQAAARQQFAQLEREGYQNEINKTAGIRQAIQGAGQSMVNAGAAMMGTPATTKKGSGQ